MKAGERRKGKRGFSLLEMLAVLVIIGLIVTMVTAATVKHVARARKTTTRASLVKVKEAVQMYKMEKGSYPAALSDLVPDYIESAEQLRDAWKHEFHYVTPGETHPFDLFSGGPDGDPNSVEDNISVWKLQEDEEESK